MSVTFHDLKTQLTTVVKRERTILDRGDLIPAAVLIPFVSRDDEPHVIFTKRAMTVGKHKGQVSLPGGAVESKDKNMVETALREAEEEIGLDSNLVDVIGLFDDQMTSTGFLVTPVIGLISPEASFKSNPIEVAEIFEVPLSHLTNRANYLCKKTTYLGKTYWDHQYTVSGHLIWGATGRIINGLLIALENNISC